MIARFHGQGTTYLDKVGDYTYWRFEVRYEDELGAIRKKVIRAKTKNEAMRKGLAFMDEWEMGLLSEGDPIISMSLYDFAIKELNSNHLNRVKESTFCTYKRTVDNLRDSIKSVPMNRLSAPVITNYLNMIAEKGASQSTINKVYEMFCRCCKYYSYLTGKPDISTSIRKPVAKKKKTYVNIDSEDNPNEMNKFFTFDEVEELEKLFLSGKYSAYGNILCFLMYSGLRGAEARALTWKDIDFDKKTVRINKAINTGAVDENGVTNNNKEYVGETKSESSNRTIPLLDKAYKVLEAQKLIVGHSKFVFPSTNGGFISASSLRKAAKAFNKRTSFDVGERTGVHVLRHTFATNMALNDMPVKSLSWYLGHSDTRITENYYIHAKDKIAKNSLEIFDESRINRGLPKLFATCNIPQ